MKAVIVGALTLCSLVPGRSGDLRSDCSGIPHNRNKICALSPALLAHMHSLLPSDASAYSSLPRASPAPSVQPVGHLSISASRSLLIRIARYYTTHLPWSPATSSSLPPHPQQAQHSSQPPPAPSNPAPSNPPRVSLRGPRGSRFP
jgi:hypothetical protein